MDWARFAEQMATMARNLLAQDSLTGTLQRITESATELVTGCDAAGILVLHGKERGSFAPTERMVTDSDALQRELGEGPCFDAAQDPHGERVFRIPDLTAETQRWPSFAPKASGLGVGSMMGILLFTDDDDFGALNFYSRRPGAFTADSELAAWLLASHAAVAFSSARTYAENPASLFPGDQHQTPRSRAPRLRTRQPQLTTPAPPAAPPAAGPNQRSLEPDQRPRDAASRPSVPGPPPPPADTPQGQGRTEFRSGSRPHHPHGRGYGSDDAGTRPRRSNRRGRV